jgi:hypothetical protein
MATTSRAGAPSGDRPNAALARNTSGNARRPRVRVSIRRHIGASRKILTSDLIARIDAFRRVS